MTETITLFDSQISIADDQSRLLPPCTHHKPQDFLNSNEYTRYILCCLTTTYHDNLVFYKFPASFKIYKGDPTYRAEFSYPQGRMIFNFNAEDAGNNGFIHEFTLNSSIEIVALDRVSNIKVLLASALNDSNIDVFDALNDNFQLKRSDDEKISIIRNNDQIKDYKILKYLCSLGFQGFAFKPLNEHPGELHLCLADKTVSKGHYSRYNHFFVVDTRSLE
jgi:hypothetical protein